METEDRRRVIAVWSARGGHGATTVATALAAFLGANLISSESWIPEWILGRPIAIDSACEWTVYDNERLRSELDPNTINLAVLRGPDLVGIGGLQRFGGALDAIALVLEPWRVMDRAETEAALARRIDIVIPFSERIARLADAGLLGGRLAELEEFADIWGWVDRTLGRRSATNEPHRF